MLKTFQSTALGRIRFSFPADYRKMLNSIWPARTLVWKESLCKYDNNTGKGEWTVPACSGYRNSDRAVHTPYYVYPSRLVP